MNYIKCLNIKDSIGDGHYLQITRNKMYYFLEETETYYTLINDCNVPYKYPKSNFISFVELRDNILNSLLVT